MKPSALLRRLSGGALQNVAFRDFRALVEATGFRRQRVSGSHHVFVHPEVAEIINLQDVAGEAKPYQVRQFLRLVERYNLKVGAGL
jgi:predicted RNA binding protein YcfA (HicA-like mRNA interferase family)